jgi:hypothetical protein
MVKDCNHPRPFEVTAGWSECPGADCRRLVQWSAIADFPTHVLPLAKCWHRAGIWRVETQCAMLVPMVFRDVDSGGSSSTPPHTRLSY